MIVIILLNIRKISQPAEQESKHIVIGIMISIELGKILNTGKELNMVPATVENLSKELVEVPRFKNKKSDDNKSVDMNESNTTK